jgi:hypothetical protein
MRRVVLSLVGALLAVMAATTSASAAPIDVNADPGEGGAEEAGVTVTVTVEGTPIQQIKTGQLAEGQDPTTNFTNGPGLCATGVIHTSCTPASEAAPNK